MERRKLWFLLFVIMIGFRIAGHQETSAAVRGTIYYVSADGTGDGTSSQNPMSVEKLHEEGMVFTDNDQILFRCGDTFYGPIKPVIHASRGKEVTIGSYGNGPKPLISGAKIVNQSSSWVESGGCYKIDLADLSNFSGVKLVNELSSNIGFIESSNGTKYYNRKWSKDDLTKEYDFYCDIYEKAMYFKCSANPYEKLGKLLLATDIYALDLENTSHIIVRDLHIRWTGGHGIRGGHNNSNIRIKDCVIEDIGGSWLVFYEMPNVRYGNGIEFFDGAHDIVVENNIIREVYDAAFTIQGKQNSWSNITVKNNVLINNSYNNELWASENAGPMTGFSYCNNISIGQGRGWGYDARPNKEYTGELIFGTYSPGQFEATIRDNIYFNFRQLYFLNPDNWQTVYGPGTYMDHNRMYYQDDVYLLNMHLDFSYYPLIPYVYEKEQNSILQTIPDIGIYANIEQCAADSMNIDEIRSVLLSELDE